MKALLLLLLMITVQNSHTAETYLPDLKAREYKNVWGCQSYTSRPIDQGKGLVFVSLYETCDNEIEEGGFGIMVYRYRSMLSNFRLDCKMRKSVWLGGESFSSQFWRHGNGPSKAGLPLIFMPFDEYKVNLFNDICDGAKIFPRS